MAVEFILLGEVRAIHQGVSVDLGRRQERCLLGLLLIETGCTLSTERLADLLWDGQPPAAARRVVQTYITRMRALLAPYDVPIYSGSGGYRVTVAPQDIDLHRFRLGIAAAAEMTTGSRRAKALSDTLALWRGPILGDTASDHLRARVAAPFEEMRLAAIEHYAQSELDIGNADRAIVALAQTPAARPIREHAISLLMQAYVLAGRRAEALATYRYTRTMIVTELGLEPGPELQSLHEAILRTEAPTAGTASATRGAVPRELPPSVPVFVGRREETQRLAEALRTGRAIPGRGRVLVLHGRGGVGKSALAVQVAHGAAADFPDGQVYIDLCGATPGIAPRTALDALRHALRSLGVPAPEIPVHEVEAAARLRSLTGDRRILFVLDNARDAVVVRHLVPSSSACALIVTSRANLATLDPDLDLALDGLDQVSARQLLVRLGRRADDRSGAYDRIVAFCERLPLALRIAGARLASQAALTVSELADRLSDLRSRLDELDVEGLAVRSSIQVNLDALRDSTDPADRLAAWLLPRLVFVPVPSFTADQAAALAGQDDPRSVTDSLARLFEYQLVQRLPRERWGMHDLIRLFAVETGYREVDAFERHATVDRLLGWYLACATQLHTLLLPGRELFGGRFEPPPDVPWHGLDTVEAATAWLESELDNVIAAGEFALTTEGDRRLFALHAARALSWLLGKRSAWMQEYVLASLACAATVERASMSERSDALRYRGQAAMHADRLTDAERDLSTAFDLAEREGDQFRAMGLLSDLARLADLQENSELAMARLRECLAVARARGWVIPEAMTLLNLSTVQIGLQLWDDAAQSLHASLAIRRTLGDNAGLAVVLPALGYVNLELGKYDDALVHLDEAVQVCRLMGNTVDGWFARFARSVVHVIQGYPRPGLRDAIAALRLCNADRPYWTAATLRLLSIVTAQADRLAASSELSRRADLAYAAHDGYREESIEAMLRHAEQKAAMSGETEPRR